MGRIWSWTLTCLLVWTLAAAPCPAQEAGPGAALLEAAGKGDMNAVNEALAQGAPVAATDADGRTAVHLAAAQGHQATAEMLLGKGADVNATDKAGSTPLDLTLAAGHSDLGQFLKDKGGVSKQGPGAQPAPGPTSSPPDPTQFKPSLKFKSLAEFEKNIGEPGALLDSKHVAFFVPKRREKEAAVIFPYLVKAYDDLKSVVGRDTQHKLAVYAFPKGNPEGWGGTSECSIEYDDTNLALETQAEWTRHGVPHVSGYIEEMAHNFVSATRAQFGWEMIGWTIGAETAGRVANNPIFFSKLREARAGQEKTYNDYCAAGFVLPASLPYNQSDRIHAWLLFLAEKQYGPKFWPDFFARIRARERELADAASLGDSDAVRNARCAITVACFDALPGLNFKRLLESKGVSATKDVKALHPGEAGMEPAAAVRGNFFTTETRRGRRRGEVRREKKSESIFNTDGHGSTGMGKTDLPCANPNQGDFPPKLCKVPAISGGARSGAIELIFQIIGVLGGAVLDLPVGKSLASGASRFDLDFYSLRPSPSQRPLRVSVVKKGKRAARKELSGARQINYSILSSLIVCP